MVTMKVYVSNGTGYTQRDLIQLGSGAVQWNSLECLWFVDPTGSGMTKMAAREASEQLFKLEALQDQNQLFWSSGIVEGKQNTELEWMASMTFEFLRVQMQVIFLVVARSRCSLKAL